MNERMLLVEHQPLPLFSALLIIVLAGVSECFGTDGMLLFLRHINRRSFFASLLFSGVLYAVGALTWITSTWLIAQWFVGSPLSFSLVVRHVASGYIPLLLAGLAIMPYVGPFLLHVLHAWSLLIVIGGIQQAYSVPLWQSALFVAGGWLIAQLMRRLARRPNRELRRLCWQLLTGSPAMPQLADLPPVLRVRVLAEPQEQESSG